MVKRLKNIPIFYYISFLTISLAVCSISILVFLFIKNDIVKKEIRNYSQTSSLQSTLISKFISERMFNANLVSDNIFASEIIHKLYYSKNVSDSNKRAWLNRFNLNNDYYTIAVYDASFNLIYTLFDNPNTFVPPSEYFFKKAFDEKVPVFSQPFFCKYCERLHLDLIAPITSDVNAKERVNYFMLLRIDLQDYIIPNINRFNANDYDIYSVIMFSDTLALNLAHGLVKITFESSLISTVKKHSELTVSKSQIDSKDYYIISSGIENTPWYFLTCIPVKFIDGKTNAYCFIVFLTCFLLIVIIYFSLALIYNFNIKKRIEENLHAERERHTLMKHLDLLLEMADDMILLLDKKGFIKYANKIATKNYCLKGESILGAHFNDIGSQKSNDLNFDEFFLSSVGSGGIVIRTEHTIAVGKTIPVEVNAKQFNIFNETYFQFIIKDISERIRNERESKEDNIRLKEANNSLKEVNAQLKAKEQERLMHINLLLQNEKKLQEFSERFRKIFDNMYSAIVIYSTIDGEKFILNEMNKVAERIENVNRKETIGKYVEEVFPKIEEFGLLEVFRRVFRTGKYEFKEGALYRDNRISGWRENYVYKLSESEIVAIYTDVSERVKIMNNLKMMSEYATLLINNLNSDEIFELVTERVRMLIPDSFTVFSKCNLKTNVISIYKILGEDELIRSINNIISSALSALKIKTSDYSGEIFSLLMDRKLNKIKGGLFEIVNRKIPLHVIESVETLLDAKSIYAMGFVVNERLCGELVIALKEDLEQNEIAQIETLVNLTSLALQRVYSNIEKENQAKLMFKMFEAIPVMLTHFNNQTNVTMVNDAFSKSTGWLPEDAENNDLMKLCFPDENLRKEVSEFMLSSKADWREFELCTKNGEFIPTTWKNVSLDENSFLGVGIDITENKRNEREKKQLEEQLFQIQKMDAIGQVAGGIAHDFNNMLAGIIGNAEIIKESISDNAISDRIQKIIDTAEHSSSLTKQLLAFARKGQYHLTPVDIHKILDDVIEIVKNTFNKKITIDKFYSSENPVFMGDTSQIQNVFINLSLNARDAMPDGGNLAFSTQNVYLDNDYIRRHTREINEGWYICTQVSDTGAGMTDEVKKHLFEPFFTTKEVGRGTGLGLASIYGCIKNHKGFIEVYSEYSHGTVFKVYLPQANAIVQRDMDEKKSMLSFKGKRVLIVDDEEMIRDILSEILKNRGMESVQARNGEEAVRIYNNDKKGFDLVLLDMIMPVMDGKDTLHNLKNINSEVKVLMSSGYAPDNEVKRLIESKTVSFIQKPFKTNELIEAVKNMIY
jgi:PAS domain S-box-containing protein